MRTTIVSRNERSRNPTPNSFKPMIAWIKSVISVLWELLRTVDLGIRVGEGLS